MDSATMARFPGSVLCGLDESAAAGWSSLVREKKTPLRSIASLPL